MKKILMLTAFMAVITILITADPPSGRTLAEAEPSQSEASVINEETSGERFIVRSYKKRLAVFEYGNDEPVYVSGVFISELPSADRELLENGVNVCGRKELNRLLEDYCS